MEMAKETRLSAPREEVPEAGREPKRARRMPLADVVNSKSTEAGSGSSAADRPTEVERAAAEAVIAAMREQGILGLDGGRENTNVVACSLALYFDEKFESDKEAKRRFGVGGSTNVRGLWVNDKLRKLYARNRVAVEMAGAVFGKGVELPAEGAAATAAEPPTADAQAIPTPPVVAPPSTDDRIQMSLLEMPDPMWASIKDGSAWANCGISQLREHVDWLAEEIERDHGGVAALREFEAISVYIFQSQRLANVLVRETNMLHSDLVRSQDTTDELIDLVESAGDLVELKQYTRALASQNENDILHENEAADRRLYGQGFTPNEFGGSDADSD
jgi:hypothetical protein